MRSLEANGGHLRPFEAKVKLMASNITLRLFLRPLEAILSIKSLFEGVSEGGWLFLRSGFHEHVFEAKIENNFGQIFISIRKLMEGRPTCLPVLEADDIGQVASARLTLMTLDILN